MRLIRVAAMAAALVWANGCGECVDCNDCASTSAGPNDLEMTPAARRDGTPVIVARATGDACLLVDELWLLPRENEIEVTTPDPMVLLDGPMPTIAAAAGTRTFDFGSLIVHETRVSVTALQLSVESSESPTIECQWVDRRVSCATP